MIALLLAAVVQCPDGTPPPCRSAARGTPAPTSVAVLYFDNRSRDSADAYLAEGLTEQTIAQLGEVQRLTVASRFAVRRFRGDAAPEPATVGRALNVTYLVTGSVQRAGNRLRVTAEMALGDAPRALDILDRIPRGALAWSICGLGNIRPEVIQQFPDSRLRRIVEENRPPWVGP